MNVDVGPDYRPGGMMLVGRDWGEHEERLQRPFVGPAGKLLNECLSAAGVRRENVAITNVVSRHPAGNVFGRHSPEDVESGLRELEDCVMQLRPSLVVTLGNEASYSVYRSWPGRDIFHATGILERRGYLWWNERLGCKVLSTLHPSGILHQEDASNVRGVGAAILKTLLVYDLERAHEQSQFRELRRPRRDVEIVSSPATAEKLAGEILSGTLVGCDIEISGPRTISCVGFSPDPGRAYVLIGDALLTAFKWLESPRLITVWHNAAFDLYFLLTRCGVRVAGAVEDTMIAFHCNWPQLAGADPSRRSKRSHKSLRFLASLYTWDEWWKDYDFASEEECYVLNGKDTCITLDLAQGRLAHDRAEQETEAIYRHELKLIWPVVMMRARGLRIDEAGRQARLGQLLARRAEHEAELLGVAGQILQERRSELSAPGLCWKTVMCPCCRGAKKKSQACWKCAGFGHAPSKKELEDVLSRA